MNIARTILDGIVMCAVFNAVVGLFFFVFPQAYSTMFPRAEAMHYAETINTFFAKGWKWICGME